IHAKRILLHPDYSISLAEFYVNLLREMAIVRGDLDWLTLAGSFGDGQVLPPWCPDLSRRSPVVSMNASRFISGRGKCGFLADGPQPPNVKFSSDPLKCTIAAVFVDEIDGLGTEHEHEGGKSQIVQPASNINAYGVG